MSDRADYTAEEWELLYLCPLFVATAIATAAESGLVGSVKEALAVATGPTSVAREFRDNRLIQALVACENTPNARAIDTQGFARDLVAARAQAFDACRRVTALLAEKSTPRETAGYNRWLLRVAEVVARAATEGNLLGIGRGDPVSPPEQEIMSILRRELGVTR